MGKLYSRADQVAYLMKSMANACRLSILCALTGGEKSLLALVAETGMTKIMLSRHLSFLKKKNIIQSRREKGVFFYTIQHKDVMEIMQQLYQVLCGSKKKRSLDH